MLKGKLKIVILIRLTGGARQSGICRDLFCPRFQDGAHGRVHYKTSQVSVQKSCTVFLPLFYVQLLSNFIELYIPCIRATFLSNSTVTKTKLNNKSTFIFKITTL